MEKEKYYTPTIEEFHVGFEFEKYDDRIAMYSNYPKSCVKTNWHRFKYDLKSIRLSQIGTHLYSKSIRVKCLDREDIESFGAVLKHEEPNNHNIMFYLKDIHSIVFNKINRRCVITVRCNVRQEDYTAFVGTIKNKSELSRLLKQLSII